MLTTAPREHRRRRRGRATGSRPAPSRTSRRTCASTSPAARSRRRYVTIAAGGVEIPTLIIGQPVPHGRPGPGVLPAVPAGRRAAHALAGAEHADRRRPRAAPARWPRSPSLVTRQVVRPVRQAAEIAERFADGHLDERMPVHGDDELARLADVVQRDGRQPPAPDPPARGVRGCSAGSPRTSRHELRTPLTTLRMAADVMHASQRRFDPRCAAAPSCCHAELDRFEALLADLLEISRFDAGVAACSDRADRPARRRAPGGRRPCARWPRAGTPLRLHLPGGRCIAEVDPRRVERIVRNLLGNAVEHGEGRPVACALARRRRRRRDRACATTASGCGRARPRWCSTGSGGPTRPAPGSTGGTGLGLSISLEDARLHGGWLQAWGEPGAGRAVPADAAARRRRADRGQPAAAGAGRPRRERGCRTAEPAPPSSTSDAAAGSVPTPVHGLPVVRAASLPDREEVR